MKSFLIILISYLLVACSSSTQSPSLTIVPTEPVNIATESIAPTEGTVDSENEQAISTPTLPPTSTLLPASPTPDYTATPSIIPITAENAQQLTLLEEISVDQSVNEVAWAPDSETLAIAGDEGGLYIWNIKSEPILLGSYPGREGIMSVSWSPDGSLLAFGHSIGLVGVWDVTNQKELYLLEGHTSFVLDLAWSPNGQYLASGSVDETVRIWDLAEREALHVFNAHAQGVAQVDWSSSEQVVASSGGLDGRVRIWDIETGEIIANFEGHSIGDIYIAYDEGGQVLFTFEGHPSGGQKLRTWNLTNYQLENTVELDISSHYSDVTWFPDEGLFAVIGQGIWDISGNLVAEPGKIEGREFDWSPNGVLIAIGGWGSIVRILGIPAVSNP